MPDRPHRRFYCCPAGAVLRGAWLSWRISVRSCSGATIRVCFPFTNTVGVARIPFSLPNAGTEQMKAALDKKALVGLPKAERWLHHVEEAFVHRQPLNPADGESAELASLIRGNVVAQYLNLKAQPAVRKAMEEGRLRVHGWYYDILTGRIEEYDEGLGRFVPWGE